MTRATVRDLAGGGLIVGIVLAFVIWAVHAAGVDATMKQACLRLRCPGGMTPVPLLGKCLCGQAAEERP